jgi:DNA-directed RNA polymerase specialized sigma24 family protein
MTVGTVADGQIGRAATAAEARAALAELSAEYRQVIEEMYFHGRSVAETAEELGIPVRTVILRSYHGLRRLRDAMDC